jgi:hypothetical protein
MKNKRLDNVKQFFYNLSHITPSFYGGYAEVVIDYTWSRYFDAGNQLDELVQFAIDKAKAGHQVFFGPAFRSEDLGKTRSSTDNVVSFLSLWVDIDSPDKDLPADLRLQRPKSCWTRLLQILTAMTFNQLTLLNPAMGSMSISN